MNTFQRYSALIWFSLLFVVGLLVRYLVGEESAFWNFWSSIDIAFAVALGIFAFLAYYDLVHDEDEIQLIFNVEGEEVYSGLCLLRKNCTLLEVMNLLNMLERSSTEPFRYDASTLHQLLDEINLTQKSGKETLKIPMRKDKFREFKLSI